MQEIIREYGPAIISLVAIGAMIGLVTYLVGTDDKSVVGIAFTNLLNQFLKLPKGQGVMLWQMII